MVVVYVKIELLSTAHQHDKTIINFMNVFRIN